ncbi:putative reductase [Candidatus Photodesmus blepharus]|uniref:Enoyl-[acyl-carrier-protein] reductase [NADH] n=1 Tax=Candidatus Photodesmus blepharonis TaxID=1179155 RepID=A0A084CMY4_9GAMM|nr:enoyl-ACP reductase FabV [Candidatus Photodesmus blepharus]KEY91163.1 putative reductase [Candidatus Photodesmus blepharus]
MVIKPKIRGFICTTAHPIGCMENVKKQINYIERQGKMKDMPKRVLIVGSSSGYGLSSRIVSGFGGSASTIGIFFERAGINKKTGTAGFYNAVAFEKLAHERGLYSKSLNGDAFSNQAKEKTINLIKRDLGQIDMVIYSLAAPVRRLPQTGELLRSVLKPIGKTYTSIALDTSRDLITKASVDPATEKEIRDTVRVMGGEDWQLWINALFQSGVLSEGCRTLAYSYVGTELTWPIYWHGTLGKAKIDLENTGLALNEKLSAIGGSANVAVLKSVITQASSAIPMMPLYISILFKKMREEGVHEGCVEHIYRMFSQLYSKNTDNSLLKTDLKNRLRLDDWELRENIQEHCRKVWSNIASENFKELTDYLKYKEEFLNLFGFGIKGIDYTTDVNPIVKSNIINI